jgi:peptidyl-tRNA hydrolase
MSKTSPLVQYIVVRKDLAWPAGALIAQACHAATSVIHMFYEHQDTKDYLADIDNMHKIVLQVENLRHI